MSLNNRSRSAYCRTWRAGRETEALAAIEEAAAIYRELAEARPDAFLPDLAMSLNNQSTVDCRGCGTAGGGAWPRSRKPSRSYRELAADRIRTRS